MTIDRRMITGASIDIIKKVEDKTKSDVELEIESRKVTPDTSQTR